MTRMIDPPDDMQDGEGQSTDFVWECGPHANVWNGHDARCRKVPLVHWFGEPGQGPSTLHGNGPAHLGRGSGDEDEVTCRLCLTLLGRREHLPTESSAPDLLAALQRSMEVAKRDFPPFQHGERPGGDA